MLKELESANRLLGYALDRYVNACLSIENYTILRVLPDRFITELRQVASFDSKLRQAQVAISRTLNYSTSLITINSLPLEILLRIFRLVMDTQDSSHNRGMLTLEGRDFSKYPDILTHVCSRWRSSLLRSRPTWVHLDLIPYLHKFSNRLFLRAQTNFTRAGNSPLTLHIVNPFKHKDEFREIPGFLHFLASIAPQTKTLKFVTDGPITSFDSLIFETFLENSVPGVLDELELSNYVYPGKNAGFIGPAGHFANTTAPVLPVGLSSQWLDGLWRTVTALRLTDLYPYWTSRAYHGLTELCIDSCTVLPDLPTTSQLLNILRASPGLQALRLTLKLMDGQLDYAGVEPVYLNNLKVLQFSGFGFDFVAAFLQGIHPGPNSLRMSISIPFSSYYPQRSFDSELSGFFARSKVTKLRILASPTAPWLTRLLTHLPNLEFLALGGISCSQVMEPTVHCGRTSGLDPTRHRLDTLHFFCSHVNLPVLQQIVDHRWTRTITFWGSLCYLGEQELTEEQDIENKLINSSATVRLLDGDLNRSIPDLPWDCE